MNDLNFLEINNNTIEALEKKLSVEEKNILSKCKKTMSKNIHYLKNLGIENIDELFEKYYYMFAIDESKFISIFDKYEKEDLIDKLNKNSSIIEFL